MEEGLDFPSFLRSNQLKFTTIIVLQYLSVKLVNQIKKDALTSTKYFHFILKSKGVFRLGVWEFFRSLLKSFHCFLLQPLILLIVA